MMKRLPALLLALVLLLSLSACGEKTEEAVPTPEVSEEPAELIWPTTYCLGKAPASLDPAQYVSTDDATYLVNLYSGLVAYRRTGSDTVELTADLCENLPAPTVNESGQPVYTFRLRENLEWSDGSPLTAADFVYAWNRVVQTPDADERYLFDCIDGYDKNELHVTASEDGRTLTVVLAFNEPNFLKLLANPVFFPVQKKAVDSGDGWSLAPDRLAVSGPFRVAAFAPTGMILEKNERYWDARSVTADVLRFDFTDDPAEAAEGWLSGRYAMISTLPSDQLNALRTAYKDEYHTASRVGVYSLCFNLNDPALKDFTEAERVQLRQALSLLIDRQYICDAIAKSGQVPASSYVPDGITDADGSLFTAHNGPEGKGGGYYKAAAEDYSENVKQALSLLRAVADSSKKFTVSKADRCVDFPELKVLTSDSFGHVDIANYLRDLYAKYGIKITISAPDLNTFLAERDKGEYSITRSSWTADYDDPTLFLNLWSTSGNHIGLGWGEHANYRGYSATIAGEKRKDLSWMESYDGLLYSIMSSTETIERYRLMHEAENLLMSTWAVCPLYLYTDVYLATSELDGMYTSPMGAKYLVNVVTHDEMGN